MQNRGIMVEITLNVQKKMNYKEGKNRRVDDEIKKLNVEVDAFH